MALKDLWQRLTRLDRCIVAVLLILCVVLFVVIGRHAPGESVQVKQDDAVIFKAPLSDSRKVDLSGVLGITELEIIDGKARIISSPCPFKVCIGMGEISRSGEIIACVPNRLLIQVVGVNDMNGMKMEQDYDLLSR